MTNIVVESLSFMLKERGKNKRKISVERSELDGWVKQAESLEDDVKRLSEEAQRQKELAGEAVFAKEKAESSLEKAKKDLKQAMEQLGEAVQEVQRLQDELEKSVVVHESSETIQAEAPQAFTQASEEEAASREEFYSSLKNIQRVTNGLLSFYGNERSMNMPKAEVIKFLEEIARHTKNGLQQFHESIR